MKFSFVEKDTEEPEPVAKVVTQVPKLYDSKGMDLESVKTGLKAAYGSVIDDMVSQASGHQVTDEASERGAVEMAGQVKKILKAMEDQRKQIISVPDAFVRGVNGIAKMFKDRLSDIETGLKKKISDYGYKKLIADRERERIAREEQAKLEDQIKKEAAEAGVEAPVVFVAPVEKKETVVRSESGSSAHLRTEWTFELVDLTLVDPQYLMLDEKKVKAAIKSGLRNMAGLRIFEKPITVLRA